MLNNVEVCVEIGKLINEVKRYDRWAKSQLEDRDKALDKLNALIITNGGDKMTIEDVLAIRER